jgi:chromosome partitioning protein
LTKTLKIVIVYVYKSFPGYSPQKSPDKLTDMNIAIASQKGGTAKTSSSISIAAGLALKGKKVLLIDTDSQANSSKVLLPDYQDISKNETLYTTIIDFNPLPVRQTTIPNLFIVPSHILVADVDVELASAIDHREARIKQELDTIADQYDHIIFDCPPTLGWLTINALTASGSVIVTIAPGYFELDSLAAINRTLSKIQKFFNPSIKLLGYLFTMSDSTRNSSVSLQVLRQTYTDQVFNTVIPRNTDIRDAHMNQQDIFSYNANSNAAKAYSRLIEEIFKI